MNAPLRVPPTLLKELEKIASESRRGVSGLAKDALQQFLRAAHAEIEAEIARRRRNAA